MILDDSLGHFSQLKISFINQNEPSFFPDKHCHLTLCLHLIEPNYIYNILSLFYKITGP